MEINLCEYSSAMYVTGGICRTYRLTVGLTNNENNFPRLLDFFPDHHYIIVLIIFLPIIGTQIR